MKAMKQLVREVHRRSLWQVLGIYVAASWAVLEIVDVLVQSYGLPTWFPGFALGLLLLGLPIVLAAAFVQERGPAAAEDGAPGAPSAPGAAPGPSAAEAPADAARRLLSWRNAIGAVVLGLALWGVVAAGWILFAPGDRGLEAGGEPVAARASIAVLPFVNRSPAPDNAYFADGIHDDILTQLSKVEDLKLISRTSVMRYRDTEKNVREIGEELGVTTVLEGGVQRQGDRVRITVQLIDTRTDDHLWAETYDKELSAASIFAIQSDVARQIAGALQATLSPETRERLDRRPTESLAAYDLYTQGRLLWSRRNLPDMRAAAERFREAIDLDSSYARAYVGLADAYATLFSWDFLPFEEAEPVITASLGRALELDPLLGEAHVTRANYLSGRRQWGAAEQSFLRGLALLPGYATAHHWYALMLAEMGELDEARVEIRRAAELDPLSPIISTNVGWLEFFARDYDAAIAQYRRTLDREPSFDYAWVLLADAYSLAGRHAEAIQAARRANELHENFNWALWLAYALARAGETQEARDLLEAHREAGDPTRVALVHVALGETDAALAALERAFDEDSPFLTELRVEPRYDPIRGDPRFSTLVRRLGLG